MPREGHGSRNSRPRRTSHRVNVMPREGHGSRNIKMRKDITDLLLSCPARGMGVEIILTGSSVAIPMVMPREGHGSRNSI